jgi:hypothetical protein
MESCCGIGNVSQSGYAFVKSLAVLKITTSTIGDRLRRLSQAPKTTSLGGTLHRALSAIGRRDDEDEPE